MGRWIASVNQVCRRGFNHRWERWGKDGCAHLVCVQIGPTAQSCHLLHFIRKSIRRKKELQISSASSNCNINIKVNLKFALQQSWNFVLFYQGGMIEDALNDETELVWIKQKKAPAQWMKAESRRPSPDGWGWRCMQMHKRVNNTSSGPFRLCCSHDSEWLMRLSHHTLLQINITNCPHDPGEKKADEEAQSKHH